MHYLGCSFFRDEDRTLFFFTRKHVDRLFYFYCSEIGRNPKLFPTILLEKGDHPELFTSEPLNVEGTEQIQYPIVTFHW